MSMQDPIADMMTRIRNASSAKKLSVSMPSSKVKVSIAHVLKDDGFITDYQEEAEGVKKVLTVYLKYYQGRPVIEMISRVSRPGLRVYRAAEALPRVKGGLGVAIISTNQGVMSSAKARKANLGGEVIGYVA